MITAGGLGVVVPSGGGGGDGQNEGGRAGPRPEEGRAEGQGVRLRGKLERGWGNEVRATPSHGGGAPGSGLPEGPRPGLRRSEPLHRRPRPALRTVGVRVSARGGGGGASHLPAGPETRRGLPATEGAPKPTWRQQVSPSPPLPAPSRPPPPSGRAEFPGAGTPSRGAARRPDAAEEVARPTAFTQPVAPAPWRGGRRRGPCREGRRPRRGQGGNPGAPQAPAPTRPSSSAASWGKRTAGPGARRRSCPWPGG